MEKLQAALERARKTRDTEANQRQAAAKPFRQPQSPLSGTDQLWDELEALNLSDAALKENRVVALSPSAEATPFDILRTKVLLQMRQNGWKRLAITSPTPSCGKTTMACNLAVALTRQSDIRTILFDFDLRRPNVGKMLGHNASHSIEELLRIEVPFSQQAVRIHENVAVAIQNDPIADPTRLLLHERNRKLLDEIEKAYQPDLMIFDLPPLLVGDETRAFLQHVDCVLLIASASETKANQLDNAEREAAEYTNVLGTVLNQCRYLDTSDKDNYYY